MNNEEESKELALITSIIIYHKQLNKPLFSCFDKVFDIAKAFYLKYGLDDEQWQKLEYEEEVITFTIKYLINEQDGNKIQRDALWD